jgi:hypothetical protein
MPTTFNEYAQNNSFFKSLVIRTIKHFVSYQEVVKFPMYVFGEQPSKTAVTLALNDICEAVMQESPVNRKKKGAPMSGGRADYWAVYHNEAYFIEVKQVFVEVCPSEATWHSAATKALNEATEQLSHIKEVYGDKLTFEALHKFSFIIVTFWGKNEDSKMERINATTFSDNDTLSAVWQLKGFHNKKFKVDNEDGYTSRGILFLGKIIPDPKKRTKAKPWAYALYNAPRRGTAPLAPRKLVNSRGKRV